MIILNNHKNALFFELDGVVRRIHPDVARQYVEAGHPVPPAPVHIGQQDIITPVALWIADYCSRTGAIPVGLDQASYLTTPHVETGKPVISKQEYRLVLLELRIMLAEHGVKDVKFFTCEHTPREEILVDRGRVASKFHPTCECRYPGRGLVENAVATFGIHHYNENGKFRVHRPSQMVVGCKDARDMSIDGCAMETQWAEAIITGRVGLKDRITHAHMKAAAQLREHNHDHIGRGLDPGQIIDVDARTFGDIPALPPELDKPLGS